MRKKSKQRLTLHRETLHRLEGELRRAVGGLTVYTTCPPCEETDGGCGGGGGTSTLDCTEVDLG